METLTVMTSQMRGTAVSAGSWWEVFRFRECKECLGLSFRIGSLLITFAHLLFFFWSLSYINVHS